MAKDHGKTLKPAHLSYKCTVCTATFGQYKLFENHVYTAHSGVAKKGDKAKQVDTVSVQRIKKPCFSHFKFNLKIPGRSQRSWQQRAD